MRLSAAPAAPARIKHAAQPIAARRAGFSDVATDLSSAITIV
jgi:hypothetical protein